MALDINEARKGSGESDAFLGLAKELTDFGERQSFLRMKDMPFEKALIEHIYPEEPSAAETLYEDTKWWGLNPESQYSFIKYWETSSNRNIKVV